MTAKEAIETFKNYKICNEGQFKQCYALENCEDCKYIYTVEELCKASELAIEALEKQISKKPKDVTNYGDVISWICPNCGKEFRNWAGYRVCHNCGQILDWSDENDK